MDKKSTHNAVAVRAAYERAQELYNMIISKQQRNKLAAMVFETAYRSDKTAGHLSGMPAKLWKEIMAEKPLEMVMISLFGDKDAGIPVAKPRKMKVDREDSKAARVVSKSKATKADIKKLNEKYNSKPVKKVTRKK
jgi:hypothetical protein